MSEKRAIPDDRIEDRTRWLAAAGMCEIALGGLSGLFGLLLPLSTLVIPPNPDAAVLLSARTMLWGIVTLELTALFFITMGIGTIRARRWARDIMLVTGWLWLIVGVPCFGVLLSVVPRVVSQTAAQLEEPLGTDAALAAVAFNVALMGFFYVLIPGALVLFYGNRSVRGTFEKKSATAGWTGMCPLTVFTLSQFLAGAAIAVLIAPFNESRIPIFGSFVGGFPGKIIMILMGLLLAYLTWAIYKLKAHAWWVNLSLTVLGLFSFVITFWQLDMKEYYARSGLTTLQIVQLSNLDLPGGRTLACVIGLLGLAWIGFLLLIKKHFGRPPGSFS